MKHAMERHRTGEARVIPIILRPCDWPGMPFGRLKAVPKDGRPVSRWDDPDEAFMDVVGEIRRAIASISKSDVVPPAQSDKRSQSDTQGSGLPAGKNLAGRPEERPPLRFSVFSDPVRVRGEGTTELVGDIFLECTYDGPTAPSQPLGFSLKISVGTNITSRSYSSSSRPSIGGDPVLLEVGRAGAPAFLFCTSVKANKAAFDHIQLDYIQPGEKRVFRVTNIRCNASGLGWGVPVEAGFESAPQILAAISISGAGVTTHVLATIDRGLKFQVIPSDRSGAAGFAAYRSQSLPAQRIASIRFIEGFPNAFKSRVVSNGNNWSIGKAGKVYHSESCVLAPVVGFFDGRVISTGLADYGTRLQASFTNISDGIKLYVSCAQVRSPISAHLVTSESSVAATNEVIDGVEVREVSFSDMTTIVVWEVDSVPDRGWSTGEAYTEFGVYCGYESRVSVGLPLLGTSLVCGHFAPVPSPRHFSAAAGFSSSDALPIPRFMNASIMQSLMRVL